MAEPRKYPDELRDLAVRLVQESGRPTAHVADDLGVHREALRGCVRQAAADRGQRPDLLSTTEYEELKRLRQQDLDGLVIVVACWPAVPEKAHAPSWPGAEVLSFTGLPSGAVVAVTSAGTRLIRAA